MPRRKQDDVPQPSPAADPTPILSSPTTATATTTTSSPRVPLSAQSLRKRPLPASSTSKRQDEMSSDDRRSLGSAAYQENVASSAPVSWTTKNQWVVLAIASGACAAFNGVFAKLTTNDLTTHISQGIAKAFGLDAIENVIELIVRGGFFGLNLIFNGVMWTLFTKALARGSSTTQVSIMNTSTNFMITALLGLAIFSESLPPLWWLGAAMLVAGNVIIGRKEEPGSDSQQQRDQDAPAAAAAGEPAAGLASYGAAPPAEGILPVEKDSDDEDIPLLGPLDEPIGR
ncbi:Transcription initiation factor IIA subunit 2 [Pestalotiopsis sp. IQ-011]